MPQLVKARPELAANAAEEQKNKDLLNSLAEWWKTTNQKMEAGEFQLQPDGSYKPTAEAKTSEPSAQSPAVKAEPVANAGTDPNSMLATLVSMGMQSVAKGQDAQIQKAMVEDGVPSHAIINDLVNLVSQVKVNGQQQGQMPNQMQGQPQEPMADNSFKRSGNFFFRPAETDSNTGTVYPAEMFGGFISDNPNTMEKRLDVQLKAQKLAGKEPMQEKDKTMTAYEQATIDMNKQKEKTALKVAEAKNDVDKMKVINESFSKAMNPTPLSGESGGKYQMAVGGAEAATELIKLFNENPKSLYELDMPGNKIGQRVAALAKRILNNEARLQGGATLSENEVKMLKSVQTPTGLKANLSNPELMAELLNTTLKTFNGAAEKMYPAGKLQNIGNALMKEGGLSRDEAAKVMFEKGLI